MSKALFPYRHRTLGALKDADMYLRAFCLACDWSAILDNDMLVKRLGRTHGSMPTDLVPVLICSQCGSKDLAITLAVNEAEVPKETADHIRAVWRRGEYDEQ